MAIVKFANTVQVITTTLVSEFKTKGVVVMPPHIQTMMFNHFKHHLPEALERCRKKEEERKEKEREQQRLAN